MLLPPRTPAHGAGLPGYECHDALGDGPDGAENSLWAVVPHAPRRDALRLAAARFGLLAGQKDVLLFFGDAEGPDAVFETVVRGSAPDLRPALDRFGLPHRTLVPGGDGCRAVVFSAGRGHRGAFRRMARSSGGVVEEVRGKGEWLGAATRAEARLCFEDVIRRRGAAALPRGRRLPDLPDEPAGMAGGGRWGQPSASPVRLTDSSPSP